MCNKMVKFITLFIITMVSLGAAAQSITDEKFTDINKNEVSFADNENSLFLITSTQCGYCLINAPFYNKLAEEFSGKYRFVALYDSSSKEINKSHKTYPQWVLKGWTVVPACRRQYLKYLDRETYPQVHVYKNGELQKISIGTLDSIKNDLVDFLRK